MDSKTWYSKQKNDMYYNNKDDVNELIKLCGNYTSDTLKITYTYVAICDSKNIEKTHFFFIFTPFITGLEKYWCREQIKPWEETYSFTNYREDIPYFFIKDDCMNVPKEFYEFVNNGRDVYVLKYEDYKLQPMEYTYIGIQPTLYSIDFKGDLIKEEFETWYNKKESKAQVRLKFTCPLKDTLPFRGKDIVLDLTRSRTTFSISRD